MAKKTANQQIVANDILNYKTNKLASSLALGGIAFSALYFCLLYSFQSTFFATWKIGFSVILTLFSLLITFLASEGIKNYKKNFCIVLLVLAAVQIIRMFGLPLEALRSDINAGVAGEKVGGALTGGYFFASIVPSVAYTIAVVWLALSAAALVAAAVIGYINCVRLESHNKKVAEGTVDIDRTLLEMDEEEEGRANPVAGGNLTENELKPEEEDQNA